MHSDSHALATLLLIRDIQSMRATHEHAEFCDGESEADKVPVHESSVICEILDSRTRSTIMRHSYVRRSSDFIQSNRLIAQFMAMIAGQRSVKKIFEELLGVSGCKLVMESSDKYS